uniref:Uncharacterized protein n=1 Tax=Solanum tuberosum TaxID=4113 RepID=M1DLH3_SOLTU
MTQIEKATEKEDWVKCFLAEARAIDARVSINLEKDWIEDSEYNVVDHVEKQDIDFIDMKQEPFENAHTSLLEAEVSSQSFVISRSITGLEQILEANGDDEYQIDNEVDLEGQISGGETVDIIIGNYENDKHFIKELRRECDGGFCASDEASQEIDDQFITDSNEATNPNKVSFVYGDTAKGMGSKILNPRVPNLSFVDVYPNSPTIGKLRKRGSLSTQQGDNSHGSITYEESSSFEEPRGLQKKLLRSSPRNGAKHHLSSSATSVG